MVNCAKGAAAAATAVGTCREGIIVSQRLQLLQQACGSADGLGARGSAASRARQGGVPVSGERIFERVTLSCPPVRGSGSRLAGLGALLGGYQKPSSLHPYVPADDRVGSDVRRRSAAQEAGWEAPAAFLDEKHRVGKVRAEHVS